MERTRSSRSTTTAVTAASKKNLRKESPVKVASPGKNAGRPKRGVKKDDDEDESPFFGFSNSDIPQPIVIKTEPVEDGDDDDCVVVNVTKAAKPLPLVMIKKEKEDDDDIDSFHGFSLDDLPKPIVIKEEPIDHVVSAERAEMTNETESFIKTSDAVVGPRSNIPGDDLLDEFEASADVENNSQLGKPISSNHLSSPDLIKIKKIVTSPIKPASPMSPKMKSPSSVTMSEQVMTKTSPGKLVQSPQKSGTTPNFVVIQGGKPVMVQQPKFVTKPSTKHDPKPAPITQIIREEPVQTSLPQKIQIIDQNGEKIELITQESEGDFDTGDETEDEDHEFTVIVEENNEGQVVTNITGTEYQIEENNIIEGESIEEIIAKFENESGKSRSVSCPNCRKCFVSSHFLNLHISNSSTMCDLCNTQCCSQVNLRNHKNLECDLSKRKRNIDLIAKETALLGRKPIDAEKYYNLPIEDDEEDNDMTDEDYTASPPPAKKQKSINDAKYECSICGKYVKILDSHMRFVHGMEEGARGSKARCPECSVLVSDLETHIVRRHGENAEKIVIDADSNVEVVRCRHPGCDLFFNNSEEVEEHMKREHTDEVKLACGMGGCDEVFDNRGALKRHRTEAHPELEEFKPVDLEPDDPDRGQDLTVACPVCERKFKHKNTCTVHIKTNHLGWSKRKLFECPDCFRAFDNKKAVESHREAVHLGIRTVCPLCEKPVTRLDLHVRMVHTELPEWPCPGILKFSVAKVTLDLALSVRSSH